jgi:endonuclease VIII
MPEGDSIFRAARTLARALEGRTVTQFETAYAQLDRFDDQQAIAGRTVEKVEALGKHLLMRFSGGLTLRTHMRMNGSWHIYRPGERWQRPRRNMRVLIGTEAFVAVAFDVPVAEFLDDRALARSPELQRLGPDLLGVDFDPAAALARLRARGQLPIHQALLDQTVVAGIGNVYRSELLFLTGLHPDTPVAGIAEEQMRHPHRVPQGRAGRARPLFLSALPGQRRLMRRHRGSTSHEAGRPGDRPLFPPGRSETSPGRWVRPLPLQKEAAHDVSGPSVSFRSAACASVPGVQRAAR